MEGHGFYSFRSQAANEDSWIQFFVEWYIDYVSIGELIDFVAFVDKLHGVKSCVGWEVVAPVVAIWIIGSNGEEITDRWMMRDLLAVDLSAVGVGAL